MVGKAAKALCVHVRYHYADLVHVSGQHDPLALLTAGGRAFHSDQVAQPVGPDLIDQSVQMVDDRLTDPLLLPAGAEYPAQLLDQCSHASLHSAPNGCPKGPDKALLINWMVFFTSSGSINAAGVWI